MKYSNNKGIRAMITLNIILSFLIILLVRSGSKKIEKNNQIQQLFNSEKHKTDSLKRILSIYEYVAAESIINFYKKEYEKIHDSIDSNSINQNIRVFSRYLSNRQQ